MRPRHVHLTDVDSRSRVIVEPVDDIEERLPVVPMLRYLQWLADQPRKQRGPPAANLLDYRLEVFNFLALADQRRSILGAVYPSFARHLVRA